MWAPPMLTDKNHVRCFGAQISGDETRYVTVDFGDNRCESKIPAPQETGTARFGIRHLEFTASNS